MANLKRMLAMVLCMVMVFSALPIHTFAAEADVVGDVVENPVIVEETQPNKNVLEGGALVLPEPTIGEIVGLEEIPDETQGEEIVVVPAAVADGDVAKIGDTGYATLADAVAAAVDGDTIVLLADMDIAAAVAIKVDVTITAESAVTLTRTGTNDVFDVNANATLTLEGPITLVGSTKYGTMVDVLKNGTFIMNDGVTIKDNNTGKANYAGGVTVTDGTFIMNGGTIDNCGNSGSSKPGSTGGGTLGGGVRVIASKNATVAASFVMNGGTISNCSSYLGGAIGLENKGTKVAATVTMNGGTITGCSSSGNSANYRGGSAVYIYNKIASGASVEAATFTMNGGKITGNTAKYNGALCAYTTASGNSYGGKFYILGGTISGNKSGNGTPGSGYGNGIYLDHLVGGKALLTIGGDANIQDDVHLKSSTGHYFEILDSFTGYVEVYSQAGGTGSTPVYGTLVAKQVSSTGVASTATKEIAGRIVAVYGQSLDANGNVYEHPVYDVVLGENADEYVLGEKQPDVYTVTYTDGVENEEVFADQVYSDLLEGTATPAFNGTPARDGYTFEGWNPEVAATVTGDATYTAIWEEIPVVARLESTGVEYQTLQAAVNDALALMVDEAGAAQTVTLLESVTESVSISWTGKSNSPAKPTLTIDLNGKTVTGNGGSVFTIGRYGSYPAKQLNVVFKDSVGTGVVTGGTGTVNGSNTYGGAIYAKDGSSYITIEGGTWTGNTATHGAVVAAAYSNNTNYVTINGGILTGNTATGNGGAIYGRYVFINGGTITGNSAVSGGGVYVFIAAATKLEMTGGAVYGNTASVDGDDIIWRANKGNTSTAYMKLIDASKMTGNVATGWYKDDADARFSEDNAVEFTSYAKFTTLNTRVALKAVKVIPSYTITYTDGVNGAAFADQVYTAKEGTATPAFDGTPTRDGHSFAGWTPEVAETVTGNATYTATWAPAAPDKYGYNVVNPLLTVICDSDEDHAPVDGKWYPQNCAIYPHDSTPVWNEELGTWTIDVRIQSLTLYYVTELEDAYNDITHTLVDGKGSVEDKMIVATLKWDAAQELWVPTEALEVHATCQTAPTAPTHMQLKSYQIKVHGLVNGEEKTCTTNIPEGSYTVGEVYGSREEGFFVDITTTIEDGDVYFNNWIAQCAPGKNYVYDWTKTPATVTYTLTYNGDLNGTLYGHRHASNTNYDWIIGFDYKGDELIWGVVADAYVGEPVTVTYTDGVDGQEIFADETYECLTGQATPAFQGVAERAGYYFAGWDPELSDVVTGSVTYTAQWIKWESVCVYAVTNGDKANAELVFSGKALHGTNTIEWLDANVTLAEKEGYTLDKWYNWDWYGHKVGEDATVNGWTNVYVTYTGNTYTITLDPNGGAVDPTTVEVTYGMPIGELPVPTREGYTFAGWMVPTRAMTGIVTAETIYDVAGDSTLVAQWTANTYTVTLDANGGTVDPETVTVTYDEAVGTLPTPTKEGYTFAGWVDAEGNVVTEETLYTAAADGTLTAQWTANTYTVTLDAGKGKVDPTTVEVTYGEAVGELPTPTRKGYTFKGWYDAEGNKVTAETVYETAGDSTYTAKWKKNSSSTGSEGSSDESPETGDSAVIYVLMFTMLISAAGAVMLVLNARKRNFNR